MVLKNNEVQDVDESDVSEARDVIYSINNFGADFLVDGLVRRLDEGDIYTPAFQRKFVWTHKQSSRFIESILLGLPIPGIFLYREEETRKHLIIDGLQRLTTIRAFCKGELPGNSEEFRLSGLKSKFNDLSLNELEAEDKRRFFDTAIHATIIQQLTPENDKSSAYYIFERLNTGGTPLQPQEIRAAVYHGKFQDFLEELNEEPLWRDVFGRVHLRAKDQELLLRFFAFRHNRIKYKAPLKEFLNDFMEENRNISPAKKKRFSSEFLSALEILHEVIGRRLFRPVRVLNAATFDSVLVVVSENIEFFQSNKKKLARNYENLLLDREYLGLVTKSTADAQSVSDRFDIASAFLLKK